MAIPKVVSVSPEGALTFDFEAVTTEARERTIKMKNISPGNVAVKIKTTAPQAYLVRPSNGFLKKDEELEIYIQLRGGQKLKPGERKVNHRFQIQATSIEGDENLQREDWQALGKEMIQEERFQVLVEGAEAGDEDEAMQRRYNEKLSAVSTLEKEVLTLQSQLDAADLSKSSSSFFCSWHLLFGVILAILLTKIPLLVGELNLR